MNEQERQQRIADLVRVMDESLNDPPALDWLDDINEVMGWYDGKLMALGALWSELKPLLGLRRDGFDDDSIGGDQPLNPPSPTVGDDDEF